MDKTHYERRSHEQGNYEITPTYQGQVVVTIKSLATGQTMKVYLDEPTHMVDKNGINVTRYAGHFNEEEFIYTPSEGLEITGLPLVYPYNEGSTDSTTIVINTQNHSLIHRDSSITDPRDLISLGRNGRTMHYTWVMLDFPPEPQSPTSGNVVIYNFAQFGSTSEEPIVVPVNPDEEAEVNPQ